MKMKIFLSKNDFINDFTTLHKLDNLILALQLYVKRATLHFIFKKYINIYTRNNIIIHSNISPFLIGYKHTQNSP